MNAADTAAPLDSIRIAEDADAADWVDTLVAGECTPDEFIGEILRREHEDPEVVWGALALLDQQFRCRRISHNVFINVKARLQQHALPSRRGALQPAPPAPVETPFHRELLVGDKLCNRYQVVDILRRDALSTLVEAIDEQRIDLPGVRKRVAIRVMDETRSREPALLLRIGKLQELSHPAIARIFDVEEDSGALLLIMEFLNGASLRDLLARNGVRPLDDAITQTIVRAVAGALAYAHSQGVTHGDVSTMNVFVTQTGDVLLQGFETRGAQPVEPAADRRAFAWLAYGLLAGPRAANLVPNSNSRLRAPPGITREKWHLLRDTLTGKEVDGDILATFASDAPPPTARYGTWIASALLMAVLGIGVYSYLDSERASSSATSAMAASMPATALPPVAVSPAAAASPAATALPPAAVSPAAAVSPPAPAQNIPAPEPVTAVPARPRVDLPFEAAWVETNAPVARIWVRRRGDTSKAVTFQWWTESGSAQVDRDFRSISTRTEVIPRGAKGIEVLVPLIPDPQRREPRTFFVKIDAPDSPALLGARTLMQVAIVPPGYPVQRASTRSAQNLSTEFP